VSTYGEPWRVSLHNQIHNQIGWPGSYPRLDDAAGNRVTLVGADYTTGERDVVAAARIAGCVNLLAGVSDEVLTGPRSAVVALALAVLRDPDDLAPAAALADEVVGRVGGPAVDPLRAELEFAVREHAREYAQHGSDPLVMVAKKLGPDPEVLAAVREMGTAAIPDHLRPPHVRLLLTCHACIARVWADEINRVPNPDVLAGKMRNPGRYLLVCRACVALARG
jgi:hypothetical protein